MSEVTPRGLASPRPVVAALGIELLVLLFVGVLGTDLPAQTAAFRVAAQLFAVPVALLWMWAARRGGSPLDGLLALCLVLYAIVAWFSVDRQGSLATLGLVATWAMLFVGMYRLAQLDWARRAVAMGITGALLAWLTVFAVRWIGEKVDWVAAGGGVPNLAESSQTLLWLTPNVVPVLALLGIPFLGRLPPGRPRTWIVGLFAVVSVVVIPLSGGRAGWVGLAIAMMVYAWLVGWREFVARAAQSPQWMRLLGLGAGVAVILALAVSFNRVVAASGFTARIPLWQQAVAIFTSHPLTGGGPSTFGWLRLAYVPAHGDRVPVGLAHDVPLQTLADGGILLGASLAMLLGGFALVVWRNRARLNGWNRTAVAVLCGYAAVSFLDDHSSLTAVTAMVIILAAWLLASVSPDPPTWPMGRAILWVALGGAALLSVVPVMAIDQARSLSEGAVGRAATGDWSTAATGFRQAAQLYPGNATYQIGLGMALAERGETASARAAYLRAITLSRGDPRPYGALSVLAESPDSQVSWLEQASARAGRDPQYSYRLGMALFAAGRVDEAAAAYARAGIINNALFGAYAADFPVDLQDRIRTALPAAIGNMGRSWRLDLSALDQAIRLAWGPRDGLDPMHAAVAALQSNDLELAKTELGRAIVSSAATSRVWQVAAAVATFACDEKAERNARVMERLTGAADSGTAELVLVSLDPFYREWDLGPSQPREPVFTPSQLEWPWPFLPRSSTCPGAAP